MLFRSGSVENKDKPLCWFNRQPSSSATGELDKEALNFNADTYYVGFDANQGAELQGEMVLDYIKENADTIDRNGDGVIGYVLAIGDIGHNDSIARTRGGRSALGTGVEADGGVDSTPAGTNVDGKAKIDVYKRQAFNGDPEVVHYGVMQARTIALFYFLLASRFSRKMGSVSNILGIL